MPENSNRISIENFLRNVLVWIFNLNMLESSPQISRCTAFVVFLVKRSADSMAVGTWCTLTFHSQWASCKTICVVVGAWSVLSIRLSKQRKVLQLSRFLSRFLRIRWIWAHVVDLEDGKLPSCRGRSRLAHSRPYSGFASDWNGEVHEVGAPERRKMHPYVDLRLSRSLAKLAFVNAWSLTYPIL